MSTMTTPAAAEESKGREAANAGPEPKQLDALHTAYGDTTIADHVVEKIAGIAAREVPGVYAMGSAVGRAYTSMTQRMPGQQQSVSGGVSIEKGERQTAIGVSIVVEYGVSIVQVADNIRDAVIKSVEYGTGLDVVSVDVNVTDVHLPAEYDTGAVDVTVRFWDQDLGPDAPRIFIGSGSARISSAKSSSSKHTSTVSIARTWLWESDRRRRVPRSGCP